jgi:hypothetical protein
MGTQNQLVIYCVWLRGEPGDLKVVRCSLRLPSFDNVVGARKKMGIVVILPTIANEPFGN